MAAASAAISLGGTALKVGLAALLQHSARLKNATNENAAIAPTVDAFDADLQAIVSAYNGGLADAPTCIQALQQLDLNLYNQMRSGTVGAGGGVLPGTAWDDGVGLSGQCNKSCTAGCCVYFNNYAYVLTLAQYAMGGSGGRWGAHWRPNDGHYHPTPNGATIDVSQVYASKYGGINRPGYTITVQAPAVGPSVAAGLASSVASFFGVTPSSLNPAPVGTVQPSNEPIYNGFGSFGGSQPSYGAPPPVPVSSMWTWLVAGAVGLFVVILALVLSK